MGEQKVSILQDKLQMQRFVRSLLDDVKALEIMLQDGMFETGITRVGAEQEMVLVDNHNYRPAPIAMEALERMKHLPWVETELARFNLETNLTPREMKGSCFREMHSENSDKLNAIQEVLDQFNASLILTGILPTLSKHDMRMDNLTPKRRYKALMDAIDSQLIGSAFELRLIGIDELSLKHDSPFLEACNTSFQIHLQVEPGNFVKMYNIAQTLAAPVMAMAANSPIVFGRRLWHESRIAMFQQALDTRTTQEHMRERSPRVSFGNDWLHESILEIYQEDISRFRVLISGDVEEDALQMLKNDKVPKLRALQVHNSTVYRWNRPCYGISENGKPHLRIENRVLPSGPTVLDEVANAVFWLGCMKGFNNKVEDITKHITFEDVRDNFIKAARFGIDSKFTWFNDDKITAVQLVQDQLLPIAREGLKSCDIDQADIDTYLGVIESRARSHMNGARWMLRAYTKLKKESSQDEALTTVACCILDNQKSGIPGHEWGMPELSDLKSYRPDYLRVGEFMTTDLFTVQSDDIVELVADMMDWRRIRYTPVEDTKGKLIGLVTIRRILRHYINPKEDSKATSVSEIMIKDPITIRPDASIQDAMQLMRDKKIGCLPVAKGGELIGIITETDFLRISGRLLERLQSEDQK